MSSESFSFEEARKPVQQSTASGQPATFSFEEATGKPPKTGGALSKLADVGLGLAQSAIAVPETAVGIADLVTGGKAGKFLANEGGDIGFRPGQAKQVLEDWKSDGLKAKKQEFQQAGGILGKVGVAVRNPSLVVDAAAQSAAPMFAGGIIGRGVLAAAPRVGAAGAGAIGEGIVGAGSAAEQIRQETADGELTSKQAGLAAASGAGTALFGALGGKVANKLGIGDVDTMITQGAAKAAGQASTRSIPRQVIEGAISEGLLEELPQSVSEQIIQNLALDKPWSEGVDAAAVMGTLTGMGMGGAASGLSGFARRGQSGEQADADPTTSPGAADPNAPAPQPAAVPEAPNFETSLGAGIPRQEGSFDFTRDIETSGLSLADPADTIAARLKPSELMGLNPAAGALSREVAAFVDATPFTEVTPIEQRTGIGAQRRLSEQPIIDVDAREVIDPQQTIAARLAGPSQTAPIQQAVQQLPYNPATQGDSLADQAPQAIQAATQRTQAGAAQAEPALIEASGQAWDSYSTEQRAAVARSAGVRGAMSRSVAAKGWGDLSPNLRASIAASIQPSGLPWGASNVGNASTPQPLAVSGREGSGNLLAQGQRGTRLSGNGDGVRGGSDGARSGVAGAGVGEAGLAPFSGRAPIDTPLNRGAASDVNQAGQAAPARQGLPANQEAADPRFAGQAAAGSQAGGVPATGPASVEANGVNGLRQITPTSPVVGKEGESNPTIVDGNGNQYRVHSQRNNLVIAHPIIDGKPQVSADTTVRFWTNPETTPSGENDRTDPIYQRDADPAAAPTVPVGNAGNVQPIATRKKARQHPPTVRGSGALAEVSRALGGISPDLLADLSEKVVRNRTSNTGKKTQYTSWDNPAIPGVGPLFRKGGTGDIAEVARVLEEAGYLEAGANERDPIGAMQRAQEIIRGELRKGGSAVQVGNADAIDAEMRARLNAEMEAAMDAESDPWDDFSFTPDDLEEVGFTDASETARALTEQLIAEAEALGIDTETIREDVARTVGEEASQDEYHAATQEALRAAVAQAGRTAGQGDTSRARAGNQDGSGTAEQAGREGGQGQRGSGSDQVDDWRERAGQKARTSFESDVERSIAGSVPVVSNDIAREAASGWRSAVERRVGKWGLVDNQMDSVDRITLIKGNDLAHFYYRKGDAADRARATSAAEAWAKNDGKTPDSPREALTLEAQTEEDLRAKTEREEAAAKQAAAEKAAEQERLRRADEARDNKARADATVDDFQLGQTAEQQMSGMSDLFSMPAPESEQSQPQSSRSANSDAQLADAIDAIGDSLKRSLADAAAKARATAEDWASRQYRKSGRSVTFEGDGPSRSESVSVDGANAARRDDVVRTSNALGDAAQSLVDSLDRKGARAFLSEMLSLHTGSDAAFESTLISRLGLDGVARKGAMTSTDATKAVLSAVKQYREAIRNADSAEGSPDWMGELFGASNEAQQEPAADAPKLTQAEAKDLMSWQDMGQSGGVKTHALHFYENQADKDAKRGRMTLVRVTKGDRNYARWTVDGDDRTFADLAAAKKAAEEIGMARAVSDGYVQEAAQVEDGIAIKPGKGLAKGKFLAEVDGDSVPGGPWGTESQARAAAESWKQSMAERATANAAERARRDRIAEKFRNGDAVTNAEIESLGLKTGTSDMRWFMSTAANLFGLNSREIRPIVKDLIRTSLTDMGAEREFVPTRQALEAVARSANPQAASTQSESPKDATLEEIFDGLQSRGLKKKNATEAAKAHPLAERITLVDKHILDILSDLDDSGTIKINC